MKHIFRKALSLFLAVTLLCSLSVTAMASEALGDELTAKETVLNEETQLSTKVFWSTSMSDLRTENYITYEPNRDVKPIVTYGSTLTDRIAVSAAAKELEAEGYRVVAGINGDFYNVGTGLPIGMVVTEGILHSSDAGYYAIGFRKNGSAVLGKPGVKITADLNYDLADEFGTFVETVRPVTAVNKARVSTGGIYLYTYDFNDRHTNGITEAGVDVLCTIKNGDIAIGEKVTLTVEQVVEGSVATTMREDQVILSANLQSDLHHVEALRKVPVGGEIELTIEASDEDWEDVEYAVGALYSLVEDGKVVSGLAAGAAPRTAVGQKRDGTLIFYTIDGRKAGHSVGASLTQVAQRLIELGCETALCLDGGGSTTLSVTKPGDIYAAKINRPSEGSERAVTNQIFLVADSKASGRLSHFYVEPADYYVMAGEAVPITVSAVDTNFIPMEKDYDLSASDGRIEDGVLITPEYGGEVTVSAKNGGKSGSASVYVVETPDTIAVEYGGTTVSSLTLTPGSTAVLSASAVYNHLKVRAGHDSFTWEFEGNCGRMDGWTFYAGNPGSGTITVTAGGKTARVEVTVASLPLKTVEDFEGKTTIFDGTGNGLVYTQTRTESQVQRGRSAAKLEYTLSPSNGYQAEWRASAPVQMDPAYSALNLWVCGDGSGNILYLYYSDGTKGWQKREIAVLDFTGWQQVSVPVMEEYFYLQGFCVSAGSMTMVEDGLGGLIPVGPEMPTIGWVYLDHLVAAFDGTVDDEPPVVTLDVEEDTLTAMVDDIVDGKPEKKAISVFCDGKTLDFNYQKKTGTVTARLPESDGLAHRITVTARDASGNIGRASCDVPAGEDWVPVFTDTEDYWGSTFVEYLYTAGITTGYADGTFRPNQNITRAQFAVMLYRYLGLSEEDYLDVTLPFADLSKIPEYALPAVRALYTEGVINGSTGKDGRIYFNPNSNLTRAQAATMIGRTQEKGYASADLIFKDADRIPAYAQFYIRTMAAQGIIGGYTDGTFKPNNNITRGQMAKILYNLM